MKAEMIDNNNIINSFSSGAGNSDNDDWEEKNKQKSSANK